MVQPSDVLIGLDIGRASVDAVAFTPDGHQLARVAAPGGSREAIAGGAIEQDVGETWRAAVAALRQLGQAVPHLGSSTAALAITGSMGGACLIDDDGDPVASAWLPQDPRADQAVTRWRQDGRARQIREITGSPIAASSQGAGLAWLDEHGPEALNQAASALTAKDCIYFFCTGERATDPAAATAAFARFSPHASTRRCACSDPKRRPRPALLWSRLSRLATTKNWSMALASGSSLD